MKPPKEPKTFKYPRAYWTPKPKHDAAEIRIVYPRPHRPTRPYASEFKTTGEWAGCCWYPERIHSWSMKVQIEKLKKFCRATDNECIFIGEIK